MSHLPRGKVIPKLCGADVELGNSLAGEASPIGTGREASRLLLAALVRGTGAIGRFPRGNAKASAQDWGRHFLPGNGGAVYIDLDHLELCLPEVRSAYDHLAAWHGMLRLARAAQEDVNRDRAPDRPVRVLVNNSDGQGNSYGGHLSVLVSRTLREDLLERRLHYLAFLIAHQVSSLVLLGQGKVGGEGSTGRVTARYQLSQRADFLETLVGPQTTFRRPLVNTRDEALAGGSPTEPRPADLPLSRMHVICYDSTLCHAASLLKPGLLQIVLTLLEAGAAPPIALEDPLTALRCWSDDPFLRATARLVDGRRVTAVELQRIVLEAAQRFDGLDRFEEVVPRAGELLTCWTSTLDALEREDWSTAARRLDWVLKLALLERVLSASPGLGWHSPSLRMLDQQYASLDPAEGLYWACDTAGATDRIVSESAIVTAGQEPPAETRAWARAHLLRLAGPGQVEKVDWDHIRFRLRRGGRTGRVHLRMANPLGWTRRQAGPTLGETSSLESVISDLGGLPVVRQRRRPGRQGVSHVGT